MLCLLACCCASRREWCNIMLRSLFSNEHKRPAHKQEFYLKFKIHYPASEQGFRKLNYIARFQYRTKRKVGRVIPAGRPLIVTVLDCLLNIISSCLLSYLPCAKHFTHYYLKLILVVYQTLKPSLIKGTGNKWMKSKTIKRIFRISRLSKWFWPTLFSFFCTRALAKVRKCWQQWYGYHGWTGTRTDVNTPCCSTTSKTFGSVSLSFTTSVHYNIY